MKSAVGSTDGVRRNGASTQRSETADSLLRPPDRPAHHTRRVLFVQLFTVAGLVFLGGSLALISGPNLANDDAAIGFRYADRLVAGQGLAYNDHERVQGFSCPLYVLLLAGLHWLTGDLLTAAHRIGMFLYVASLVWTWYLAKCIGDTWTGVLAGYVLSLQWFYRYQMLSGLEVGLSVVLGLSAIAAMIHGREVVAGVLVGLAVVNKLDAGLLAIALAGAYVLARRRLPWKSATVAAAVSVPWFVYAFYYYGSILPQSMLAKLKHESSFDPMWVVDMLRRDFKFLYLLLACLAVLYSGRSDRRGLRLGVYSLAAWFVLHALVYSLLDLGANYPWYLTALFPPLLVLAAAGVFTRIRLTARTCVPQTIAALVCLALISTPTWKELSWTIRDLRESSPLRYHEATDLDRRMIGIFLNTYAAPGEVVISGFGWVDYESKLPIRDDAHVNSRLLQDNPAYFVAVGQPVDPFSVASKPDDFIQLAAIGLARDLYGPAYPQYVLYGRADSAIAKRGNRYLQYGIDRFPPAVAYSDHLGMEKIQIAGTRLTMPPPAGVVFTLPPLRERARLAFTPLPVIDQPAAHCLAIRYSVMINGTCEFTRELLPGSTHARRSILLPTGTDRLEIAFLAELNSPTPQPCADAPAIPVAHWDNIRLVVGDASIDAQRVADANIVEAWYACYP